MRLETDLSICGDGEQRLLPPDQLHRPQCGEGFSGRGNFDLRPLDAPQLAPVVVAPAVDGAAAPGRQRPVVRSPVHPLNELLVVLALEQVVTLVEAVHDLVVGHKLSDLLCDLQQGRG